MERIQNMLNVTVLAGNLFGCPLDKSGLPTHDSAWSTYSCGSNSFDVAYYIYAGTLSIALVLAVMIYYGRPSVALNVNVAAALRVLDMWIEFSGMETVRMYRYEYCLVLLDEICKVAAWSTVYVLVVMLPIYGAASDFYGTHTYEYAWSVSAAFQSGAVMASLQLVAICMLLLGTLYLFRRLLEALTRFLETLPKDSHLSVSDSSQDREEQSADPQRSRAILVYGAFFVANCTVVGTVNVLYLLAVIHGDSSYQTLAQLALSVFKLAWCRWNTSIVRWMQHYLGRSSTERWTLMDPGFFTVQLFVQLFNNIVVPCLVVAAISADCFNSALVAAPDVTSYFYYEQCEVYTVLYECLVPVIRVASTQYSPPFNYSYQCSSSFVTYYAPPFVIMCIIYTFVLPVTQLLICWLLGRATPGTFWCRILRATVPHILRPLTSDTRKRETLVRFNPYFDVRHYLIILLTYLTLLLTFGAVFPPLAVCFAVTMASLVLFARVKVGRFLLNANDLGLVWCAEAIEQDCSGVGGTVHLRRASSLVVAVCGLFYTLFLFDTLGDSVGFDGAYWVLIVSPVLTFSCAMLALYCPVLHARNLGDMLSTQGKLTTAADVELPTVSPLAVPAEPIGSSDV
jgi:hypothetical protein